MKPDWDKLMDEFKDSTTSLVADVDCTAGGSSLCEKVGVKGYPSIKWGDPKDLKDYDGGRDFSSMQKHAQENLGPTCGLEHKDLCDEETRKMIDEFEGMTPEALEKGIADAEEKVAKLETKLQKSVDKLQAQVADSQKKLEKETKKKDTEVAKLSKKLGVKAMRAVISAKKKADEGSSKSRKQRKKKKAEL